MKNLSTFIALAMSACVAEAQATEAAKNNGSVTACATICRGTQKQVENIFGIPQNTESGKYARELRGLQEAITGEKGKWIGGTWYIQNTPNNNNLVPYVGASPKENGGANRIRFGIGLQGTFK